MPTPLDADAVPAAAPAAVPPAAAPPAAAPETSAVPRADRIWAPDPESPRSFPAGIVFSFVISDDGLSATGDATLSDAVRIPGTTLPRASVLATIGDCVAGVPAGIMTGPDQLSVTLDISVRLVAAPCGERLTVQGQIVKKGRSIIAGEVQYFDAETSALVAYSYLTFMASPRPQDKGFPQMRGMRNEVPMPEPIDRYLGARLLAPGVVKIERAPFMRQAAGSLQGGVVAVLGELAAESLTGAPVVDLDVRYLSAVRVGPGRATATALGGDLVRVEVRDAGQDDRLAALVAARVRA
jgi:acyl-coenzyme A thioesterase PaaI-like protein